MAVVTNAFRQALLRPRHSPFLQRAPLRQAVAPITRVSPILYSRPYSTPAVEPVQPPDYLSDGELKVFNILKDELQPIKLEVQDISGGCGSMYALEIISEQFRGIPVIKQHRLVNKVLGEEIKKWHGVQLKTQAP